MATNFVSYANATDLMNAIGLKLKALNGAYVFKGNSTFANLPATPTEAQSGYVYNVTTDFATDSRFVEGSGKKYPAGTNVAIVDLSTYDAVTPVGNEDPSSEGWYELINGKYVLSEDTTVDNQKTYYAKTVNVKYDVISSFIDVDAIEQAIADVSAMITAEFDDATAYSAGDLCVYEGDLYIFTTDHAAGAWTGSDASATTVEALIDAINSRITGVAGDLVDVREMICDDTFNASTAYSVGDIVVKDNVLYKFKAAHTAGDPWDSSEVDAVTVVDLIKSIVPGVSEERLEDTLANFTTYPSFDPDDSYEAGDRVWYETEYNPGLQLYEFVNSHSGAWDDQDVSMIDLTDLIAEAEPDELTTAQVNTLIGLLD